MSSLEGRIGVVTGASSGIGRAISIALVRAGAQVWAVARDPERLGALREESGDTGAVVPVVADLERDEQVEAAAREVLEHGRVDVLVHSAGAIHLGGFASGSASELDRQYAVNLRAPFILTRALLPALTAAKGQVVFVNSSAALQASADNVLYAATKAGLKALADGLRKEVNEAGIRVVTLYVGRTATPMQASVHEFERRAYRPDLLLRPEDVAQTVLATLELPPSGEVTDVSIRPLAKPPEGGS